MTPFQRPTFKFNFYARGKAYAIHCHSRFNEPKKSLSEIIINAPKFRYGSHIFINGGYISDIDYAKTGNRQTLRSSEKDRN